MKLLPLRQSIDRARSAGGKGSMPSRTHGGAHGAWIIFRLPTRWTGSCMRRESTGGKKSRSRRRWTHCLMVASCRLTGARVPCLGRRVAAPDAGRLRWTSRQAGGCHREGVDAGTNCGMHAPRIYAGDTQFPAQAGLGEHIGRMPTNQPSDSLSISIGRIGRNRPHSDMMQSCLC
jgi:hypothetical protein